MIPRFDPLVVSTVELAPIVNHWIEQQTARNNGSERSVGFGKDRTAPTMGAVEYILYWTKLDRKVLSSIRNEDFGFTSLTNADKLLSVIDQTQALHDGRITVVPNPRWSNEKYQAWLEEEGRICD